LVIFQGDVAPNIRALSVESADGDDPGCITIANQAAGKFKVTCDSDSAKDQNAVKSVALTAKEGGCM
jgi:hypothetical protein